MQAETPRFRVVVNDEEQYSIWADGTPAPAGWHDEGKAGTRDECLAHIDAVWTDMRPRSLRDALAAAGTAGAGAGAAGGGDA